MKKSILLITLLFTGTFGFSQEIIQWRGENRTGHYKSENLLKEWPENGPELVLKLDSLPNTYSSVVVKDQILYTTGMLNDEEILSAIDKNGNILWNTVYGKAWSRSYANARCTPTIEGDFAYLNSGSGYLACVNIKDGSLLWSYDAYTKFEGDCGTWGIAESPLIVDDKMIFTPGGDKTTMVAVDKRSGKTVWMSESLEDDCAYLSPVLIERNGLKLIISVTATYVIAVNADNGEIFWKFDYKDVEASIMGAGINPVTPLVVNNEIFVTSGYNHAGIMLVMSDDLKSVRLKWISEELDVHHGGVVAYNGFIYGANYTSSRGGDWMCIDWETGKVQYEKEWNGKGSIILADGMLICYDERKGNIALVEATPKEFAIKSTFKITEGKGPHWSHPSIYDDKLFIRHGEALLVYDLSH